MTTATTRVQQTKSGVDVLIKSYTGYVDYAAALLQMQQFSRQRRPDASDEIWLLQHEPVFTQGTNCTQQPQQDSEIAVVKSDRGGQITYHGPGQVVVYPLLSLRRFSLNVKSLVALLEQSAIDLLSDYGVIGERRENAPGVYVKQRKIAALGLRIRSGNSYHGLSLNVDMDLRPFQQIDPCGYADLEVTQLAQCVEQSIDVIKVQEALLGHLLARL